MIKHIITITIFRKNHRKCGVPKGRRCLIDAGSEDLRDPAACDVFFILTIQILSYSQYSQTVYKVVYEYLPILYNQVKHIEDLDMIADCRSETICLGITSVLNSLKAIFKKMKKCSQSI